MIFDILLIIAGVAMVLYGADRLTEGASALARRMNVPEIIIGLTIVAAGTSAPELFVSMVSALKGTPDMAIGNVVGSNTMNAMLIVGCAAMVAPMTISKSTVRKDFVAQRKVRAVEGRRLWLFSPQFRAETQGEDGCGTERETKTGEGRKPGRGEKESRVSLEIP